ncbi:uncharacterized protein LOC143283210 [Babylonia areolata]|uniref:uncharacterized protein LOC143283210 n=1 Tax=Babylonia areolata TaxID=304850 RepID=UPI003FD4556D
MGCTYSDVPSDAGDGFTFRVYNVDSQGVKLNPGKIKVAASHLILYQKGKEAIRWPLRCLRRYGFDAELFSFECGRRCQTGPGIYAFKCRHAEDLFILVQESIQRAGEEDQLRTAVSNGGSGSSAGSHAMLSSHSAHPPAPGSHPLAFTQPQHEFAAVGGGSSLGNSLQMRRLNRSSPEHQYINGTIPAVVDSPQYVNTGLRSGAFPIEESSPLIDFMNHPGQHRGAGGVGGGARAQVNYAVILPSSMENLLDEEGQGAVTNFPPDDVSHLSLPPSSSDLPTITTDGGTALNPDDITLLHTGAGDSDVFLPDSEETGSAFPNYINIGGANESSPPIICYDEVGTATDGGGDNDGRGVKECGGGGGLAVPEAPAVGGFTSNYANLTIHSSGGAGSGGAQGGGGGLKPRHHQNQQQQHTSHYLELDLNPAPLSSDGAGGASGGGGAGVASQSPTSPTSNASSSMPESSSSYAKIDFNKTEALSHSSRAGTNGEDEPGARKTRHNSTIGM